MNVMTGTPRAWQEATMASEPDEVGASVCMLAQKLPYQPRASSARFSSESMCAG